MANQDETATWESVYLWETGDPALGGLGGLANRPLLNLTHRTAYLKGQTDALLADLSGLAPINSPTFTGSPHAPTPNASASGTEIATAAWARQLSGGEITVSISGNYTLSTTQAGYGIIWVSGTTGADAYLLFPASAGKWIIINATNNHVLCRQVAGGASVAVSSGHTQGVWSDGTNFLQAHNDYESIQLSGVPLTPTPPAGDASAQIANTVWTRNLVQSTAGGLIPYSAVSNFFGGTNGAGYAIMPGPGPGQPGLIIQWGSSVTQTGNQDWQPFPITFTHLCLSVVASERAAAGWAPAGPQPTIYGANNVQPWGFAISGVRISQSGQPIFQGGLSYSYVAVGY